ncbi:hypothetical protein [Citricoccus sp. NR2]|uniref:hypothetical protein n=1 Tax=Citricoccus sp. NR2 TaxID=3004095 RepID=UPI0022DD9CB8|nr:hypothetical protein [Citricoccus sp. NR2]WBL18067.1 hypothetical protein O1A05_09670 [Citricoccus sp. NR2]
MTGMHPEHLEVLARKAHRAYVESQPERALMWDDLDAREREANLDSAHFAPIILAALGFEIVEGDLPSRRLHLTEEELEVGARLEHLRWCRFARTSGRNEHPDLVVWEELDDRTQELDRMRIRPLPDWLHQLGYSLRER